MNESELQRVYKYPKYPRDSKLYSDKRFDIIDNGSIGGTHWNCFMEKDKKYNYFDPFGVQPDEFLLNQLPKPMTYHNYKIQDINSFFCGLYCLYFFYSIERMKFYDGVLKMYFDYLNMPFNVFGNSINTDNKIDTNLFVQKSYLRSNYIDANIEEDIDLKNQYRIKNLPDPISIRETTSKNYVDNNDPSIIKNDNPHPDIDLKYKKNYQRQINRSKSFARIWWSINIKIFC